MRAAEFARVYGADPDWVRVMGARDVVPLQPGQRGTYSGLPMTILRHYRNGMYEVRLPGGEACIDGSSVVPD